jgi:threonine dehydratase
VSTLSEDVGRVSLESIRSAADTLEGVAVRTELLESPALSTRTGVPTWLKCEQEQPVGAFKARGAYTAITRLAQAERDAGVITYSSGNHGQAIAWAAQRLGCRAVIVMPDSAPRIKVKGVEGWGGEIVWGGPTSVTRQDLAETIAARDGLTIIPPFDHPDIIAGQATCTLEILEQCPDLATLIIPVGGGGLLAGACAVIAALRPQVRVVAVEPVGAAKLTAALAAGRPVSLQDTTSVADGLLPLAIGSLTFEIIRDAVAEVVQVEDDAIAEAVRFLHTHQGLRVEPSGAATTAALLDGLVVEEGSAVAIISGGNVDGDLFQKLVGE